MFSEGICAGSLRDILPGSNAQTAAGRGSVGTCAHHGGIRRRQKGGGGGGRQAQWPFSAFPPEPHASTAAPENRSKDRARGGLRFFGAGIRGRCPPLSLLLSGRKGLSSKPPSFRRPPRKGGTQFRVQEDRGSQTYRSPPTQSASRPGQEEKDRVPASLPFSGLLSRASGRRP